MKIVYFDDPTLLFFNLTITAIAGTGNNNDNVNDNDNYCVIENYQLSIIH